MQCTNGSTFFYDNSREKHEIKEKVKVGNPFPGIEKSPCCKRDVKNLIFFIAQRK